MEQRELTVQETGRRLGYHPAHVRRFILAGRLSARRLSARVLVVPVEEVNRLTREGRQRPGPKRKRQQERQ